MVSHQYHSSKLWFKSVGFKPVFKFERNLALRVYSRWWVTIPVSEIGTPTVPLPVAVPSWLRSFRPSDLAGLFVNVNAAPSFIFFFHFFSIFAVRTLFVSREGRDLFLFFLLFAVLRLLS